MKNIFYLNLLFLLFGAFQAKSQSVDLLLKATSGGPTANSSIGRSTAVDDFGNTYIVGQFGGSASFGSTTLTSAGTGDIFLAKYDAMGVFQWARRAGGTNLDYGYGVAVSGSSVYIMGYFTGTANFNTPSATGSNEIISAGNSDIFLAKYNDAGVFQWARRAGGMGFDEGRGLAVSGSSVYITGIIILTANFNTPSATGSNEITPAGGSDMFLAKYNDAGVFQWVRRAGGTGADIGHGVAASGSSVYVTGFFNGTANFNTPSATGSNEITSAGSSDMFLAKYNDAGVFQWARRAGGTGADDGRGVAVSGASVYITGSFNGTANFNTPSATGSNEMISAGSTDVFLAKFDDAGVVQWVRRAGGTTGDFGNSVAASSSNVYIAGSFGSTADFNTPSATGSNEVTSAGGADIFLAKFDDGGGFQWASRAGGTGTDTGLGTAISGSSVYVTGFFNGTANFNTPSATGSNELTTATGGSEAFLARYIPVVLPLEWLGFEGENRAEGNYLTWETAHEKNNKGFWIERQGRNAGDWDKLGFVASKGIAANYQFTDADPLSIGHYRLRQIDYDGKEGFSKVISIENKGSKGALLVYPNPVSTVLTLSAGEEVGTYHIVNVLGQVVLTGSSAVSNIDVSALPQGQYTLKMGPSQARFVKQ